MVFLRGKKTDPLLPYLAAWAEKQEENKVPFGCVLWVNSGPGRSMTLRCLNFSWPYVQPWRWIMLFFGPQKINEFLFDDLSKVITERILWNNESKLLAFMRMT